MFEKRVNIILLAILLLFAALAMRMAYLQLYQGKKYARAASTQRISSAIVEKPRGDILDRNGIPFTDRNSKCSLVLMPVELMESQDEIREICSIIGADYGEMLDRIKSRKDPIIIEIDKSLKDRLSAGNYHGVSILNYLERYGGNSIARHVTGYLNKADQTGETGIEKAYESILRYNGINKIGLVTDAHNNPLEGMGYRILEPVEQAMGDNIKLTLDYHIQKVAEEVMDKYQLPGAVVIEDICSGDLVAMVSKPDFDQNSVENYLDSAKNELFNRAVASYNAGSIFKIIDAARCFENGTYTGERYYCPGYVRIGDKEFRCSSYEKGGHGTLGLKEAFALSCNTYFINLALKLGRDNIINMARRFGLGGVTGIKEQGIDESPGNVPKITSQYTDGDTANISIGQGGIMITPVQAADMVATVANGGIKNKVNIVDSIVDSSGKIVKKLKKTEGERIITSSTAQKLRALMEEVTVSGTGTKANLERYGGAGGKTGSAETGQYVNGKKVVHAWFVGYFPKNSPKYAASVFIEDGQYGGETAAPVFAEIAEEILKNNY